MPVSRHPRFPVVRDEDGSFHTLQIDDDEDDFAGKLWEAQSIDALGNSKTYEYVRLDDGGVEWLDEPTDRVREEVEG